MACWALGHWPGAGFSRFAILSGTGSLDYNQHGSNRSNAAVKTDLPPLCSPGAQLQGRGGGMRGGMLAGFPTVLQCQLKARLNTSRQLQTKVGAHRDTSRPWYDRDINRVSDLKIGLDGT